VRPVVSSINYTMIRVSVCSDKKTKIKKNDSDYIDDIPISISHPRCMEKQ
jgi:hypothetical protein